MLHRVRFLFAFVLVVSLLLPATAAAEGVTALAGAKRSADSSYFPLTGHNVEGVFLSFFDQNGGIDVFGYPRTEAFEENGRLVQYFQRHRMEWWPENPPPWQVQLALLGDIVLGPADPPAPPKQEPGYVYFPQTGHSVGSPFLQFFQSRGGTLIFGYPTSEAHQDGPFLVQRFQRARLELHPENPPAHRVQPGLLGDMYIDGTGFPAELTKAVPEAEATGEWFVWGSWSTDTSSFLPFKVANNEVAMKALNGTMVKSGGNYGFAQVLGAPGYVLGLGYGFDNKYQWMSAGGTCAAATTFYRAVYNAGLEILRVSPHTLVTYDPPGWDATVDGGWLDIVIRNNTATDIRFRSSLSRQSHQMTVWVEGRQPPDRTVVRRGPFELAKLSYEVNRDITWSDGRQTTERRTIKYDGYPPPVPADLTQIPGSPTYVAGQPSASPQTTTGQAPPR
ncbi:MAG: VanW family protein [Dehalococcoidales bacterium]|nr:VanW family protein [Dehalococcoidales bacterium]